MTRFHKANQSTNYLVNSGVLRDKTIAIKLMYILKDNKQCRLKLLVEIIRQPTNLK